jgi:hypothetical protein
VSRWHHFREGPISEVAASFSSSPNALRKAPN